jgi:predicted nuclease with TOPRIM domain
MSQNNETSGSTAGPLSALANTRAKLKAERVADLKRRKAALEERRELIDREISQLDAKLDELRGRPQ